MGTQIADDTMSETHGLAEYHTWHGSDRRPHTWLSHTECEVLCVVLLGRLSVGLLILIRTFVSDEFLVTYKTRSGQRSLRGGSGWTHVDI